MMVREAVAPHAAALLITPVAAQGIYQMLLRGEACSQHRKIAEV
jgi:hypothetical protein